MKIFFILTVSVIFAFGTLVVPVSAQTFNVNLTVGSRGADVVSLQQFLVARGFLQMPLGVAYGYFGPLTRTAVAKWQMANGITPPAGYFGPISRAAIASQINTPAVPTMAPVSAPVSPELFPNSETDTPYAPGMRAGKVMLFRASPFEVRPGGTIELEGSGFSRTVNQIYFNGGNSVNATSSDGAVMTLSIPTALSEGEYKLSVSNALGSSSNPEIEIAIKVTNNPQQEPVIESASIVGDTVTLVGSGFTSSNNLVTTLGNSSSPIFSDGTTLTFRITELSMYNEIKQFTLGKYQSALWIYVQTEHGINKEPYKLNIII